MDRTEECPDPVDTLTDQPPPAPDNIIHIPFLYNSDMPRRSGRRRRSTWRSHEGGATRTDKMPYSRVTVVVNGEVFVDPVYFTRPAHTEEGLNVEVGNDVAAVTLPVHPDGVSYINPTENEEVNDKIEEVPVDRGPGPPAAAVFPVAPADSGVAAAEITTSTEAKARRYRGLKKNRKRTFARDLLTGDNSKVSSYNFQGTRSELNLPTTAPPQQIGSTIAPSTPRSPLKRELKKANKALAKDHTRNDGIISSFKQKNKNKSTKIAALKLQNKELIRQLLLEKKASNVLLE